MHNFGDTVAMAGGLYELDRIKDEWNGTYGWAFQMYSSVLDMPMPPWRLSISREYHVFDNSYTGKHLFALEMLTTGPFENPSIYASKRIITTPPKNPQLRYKA